MVYDSTLRRDLLLNGTFALVTLIALKLLREVLPPGEVTHIIASHSHADHIGGVKFWQRPDTETCSCLVSPRSTPGMRMPGPSGTCWSARSGAPTTRTRPRSTTSTCWSRRPPVASSTTSAGARAKSRFARSASPAVSVGTVNPSPLLAATKQYRLYMATGPISDIECAYTLWSVELVTGQG